MVLDEQDFEKINVLSNKNRFKIFQLVSQKELNITEISSKIALSYDKTREYINMLLKAGLIRKISKGRNIYIVSCYKINFEELK